MTEREALEKIAALQLDPTWPEDYLHKKRAILDEALASTAPEATGPVAWRVAWAHGRAEIVYRERMEQLVAAQPWPNEYIDGIEALYTRNTPEPLPVFSCPACGDPFAWVTESEPDFHAGANYTCNKCGGAVIFTVQTPEQYVALAGSSPEPVAWREFVRAAERMAEEYDCTIHPIDQQPCGAKDPFICPPCRLRVAVERVELEATAPRSTPEPWRAAMAAMVAYGDSEGWGFTPRRIVDALRAALAGSPPCAKCGGSGGVLDEDDRHVPCPVCIKLTREADDEA